MNIKTLSIITILILIISSISIFAITKEEITGETVYGTIEHGEHFGQILSTTPTKFIIVDDEFSIKEVWINVNTDTESSSFKLIKLSSRPTLTTLLDTPDYHFYEVETSNILKSNTRKSKIIFQVENNWIKNNSIDSDNIKLKVFKDIDWVELPTKKTIEEYDYSQYEADVEEFLQYYVITGPKIEYYDEPETSITETKHIPPKTEKPSSNLNIITGLIIFALLGIVIYSITQFKIVKRHKK